MKQALDHDIYLRLEHDAADGTDTIVATQRRTPAPRKPSYGSLRESCRQVIRKEAHTMHSALLRHAMRFPLLDVLVACALLVVILTYILEAVGAWLRTRDFSGMVWLSDFFIHGTVVLGIVLVLYAIAFYAIQAVR